MNILLSFIVIVSSFIFSFDKISLVSANPFSFQDIITDIIYSPLELIKRAINGVIESIAGAIESFDIPFTDAEQDMANALRKLKLEEGMTKTEERDAEIQKARDERRAKNEKIKNSKKNNLLCI